MLRVVFDTVVFVRSLINPHGRWGELIFEHYHKYTLAVSKPIVTEILEVLHRPEIIKKFRTEQYLDLKTVINLLGKATVVKITEVPDVSRDPKDNIFIATAVNAGADYLISEDEDLLTIGSYKGVKIVNSLKFLKVLANLD